jgi:hypothetical protein
MRWIGGPRAGGTAGFVRLIENCSVCSTAFAVSTCNQCKAWKGDPAIPTRRPNFSMPNPIVRNFRVWLSRPWSPAQSARVLAFGPPLPPAVRSAPPLRPPRAHTSYGIRNATTVPGCRASAPAGRAGRGGSLWSVGSRLGPRASHGHAPPFSITPPCTAASQT